MSEDTRQTTVALREHWCLQVRATAPRSAERTAALQAMAEACDLSIGQCYALVQRFVEKGRTGLERREHGAKGRALALPPAQVNDWIAWATDLRRAHWPVQTRINEYRAHIQRSQGREVECSDMSLQRYLKKADPRLMMTAKQAQRELQRRMKMEAPYANFLWQADQRQADLFVREIDEATGEVSEYRPLLFSFIDYRSGAVMGGFYFKGKHTAYPTEIVEAALLDSIYANPRTNLPFCGTPEVLYWDNGAPHKSAWMRRLAEVLGIELVFGIPGEPEAHGLMEGYHRIIKDRFECTLPGFVGGDNREDQRPAQMRLYDEGELPGPVPLLTLDELNDRWYAWQGDLHRASYRKGASRLDRWVATVSDERRAVPNPERLALEAMHVKEVAVRDGHFQLHNVVYTAPGLGELNGLAGVKVHFLRGCIWRVFVSLRGAVLFTAEPAHTNLWRSAASFAEVGQRKREAADAVQGLKRSKRVSQAAADMGLLDPDQAAAAADLADQAVASLKGLRAVEAVERVKEAEAAERAGNVVFLGPAREKRLRGETEQIQDADQRRLELVDSLLGDEAAAPRERVSIDDLI